MKKQILILILGMMICLMIVTTFADTQIIGTKPKPQPIKLCRTDVDIKEATEQVTTTKQIPVMEDKIITTKVMDTKKYDSDRQAFVTSYKTYISAKNNSKIAKPIVPTVSYTTTEKTIQVQKVETKTTYSINWLDLKIESKTIQVPVYESKEITTNKLKDGYTLDEDTGEIYTMSPCKDEGGIKQ